MLFYFDPVTKQIWSEGLESESESDMNIDEGQARTDAAPTPPTEVDFGDDELNAAARLASVVSHDLPSCHKRLMYQISQPDSFEERPNPVMPFLPREGSVFQPDASATPLPAFSSQTTPRVNVLPTFNRTDPSGSPHLHNVVESDSESQHRLSAADKGKQPATSYSLMSEDEPVVGEDEMFRGSVTPTPCFPTQVMVFTYR